VQIRFSRRSLHHHFPVAVNVSIGHGLPVSVAVVVAWLWTVRALFPVNVA
jgi:hypothetical protein